MQTSIDKHSSVSGVAAYAAKLSSVLNEQDWTGVESLVREMAAVWRRGSQVFLCGNGGSAANAVHIANDFVFPVAKDGKGLRITALPANTAILTCLANDIDYGSVYSRQIEVFGQEGDLLIVLSGSGNSPNVVQAIETAREIGMTSAAILGFNGGRCLDSVDIPIHFEVDDMQIVEDLQLVVGHMVMTELRDRLDSATDFNT